jgi:CBS domain-containing protein
LATKPPRIITIGPEAPVIDALRLMAEHEIGALPVLDGHTLVGILSERDYARKVVLLGRASKDTPVRDIMTSPVRTVTPDETIEHCMQLVTDRRIRHLPVLADGRLIGILSIGDLVKSVIEEQQQTLEQLERYIAS